MSKKGIKGFGFDPEKTTHHFLVSIPTSRAKDAEVTISEHYDYKPGEDGEYPEQKFNDSDNQIRVIIKRALWDEISDDLKAEFNRRLRNIGVKAGKWLKKGQIPVDKSLGKELVLLCWAIEDADPNLLRIAIRNWMGLAPEERWWLYTMTNASTGHAINGRGKGWRKAIRFALTENPVSDSVMKSRSTDFELTLKL